MSYKELLRIPSISTLPEHKPDIERAARWIADELTRIGFENAAALGDDRPPERVRRLAPRRWRPDDPRVPPLRRPAGRSDRAVGDRALRSVRQGRADGRAGSADDKGQLHMHLKAAEAIPRDPREAAEEPQVPVRGRGGTPRRAWTSGSVVNKDMLAADAIVISDTGFEGNVPALTTSLRGMVYTRSM